MTPSTYSIVACDLEAGEWGIGVQSRFLAVGSLVAYAEPAVGGVVTQAWAKVSYGPDGLALLRDGHDAQTVIEQLTATDPGRETRQLGVVDGAGRAASFTGKECLDWAGGVVGSGFAAQGNILVSAATVAAIARTYEQTAGARLAERLLAALQAGQAAGGDRRGQQSAALYVVRAGAGYDGCDVLTDLRVDDHPHPLDELERLYGLHQLYFGTTAASEWIDVDAALAGELQRLLASCGEASGDLARDFDRWVGAENLEHRADGIDRVDPVVLRYLRDAAARLLPSGQ